MPRRRTKLPTIDNLATWPAVYVTVQQLATYWGFHAFTIARWCRAGDLPATRFRGSWRIKADDARLYELKLFSPRKSA